jgi:hypothetical protein
VFRTCCPDWRHSGSSSNSSSSNHLSRVGSPGAVKVFVVNAIQPGWRDAKDGVPAGVYTKNVVYREVFN